MLTIFKMIEYVNLFLLLTMFGSTCYVYYKLKKFFYLISILMDSEILDQSTNPETGVVEGVQDWSDHSKRSSI